MSVSSKLAQAEVTGTLFGRRQKQTVLREQREIAFVPDYLAQIVDWGSSACRFASGKSGEGRPK